MKGAKRAKANTMPKSILVALALLCLVFISGVLIKERPSSNYGESVRDTHNYLSTFSTTLNADQESRNVNIKLACESLNEVVIEPNAEFSFNNVVGKRVKEEGYLEARGIEYGKSTASVGGGICQVSTTLYNVALRAGFDITERMHHSRPASYVPDGMDAMVAWEASDLKFINSLNVPVVISAFSDQNRVVMSMKIKEGFEDEFNCEWTSVELTSTLLETVYPKPKGAPDMSGKTSSPPKADASHLASSGLPGLRVQVVRTFEMKDGSYVNEIISEDYYEPSDAVIM